MFYIDRLVAAALFAAAIAAASSAFVGYAHIRQRNEANAAADESRWVLADAINALTAHAATSAHRQPMSVAATGAAARLFAFRSTLACGESAAALRRMVRLPEAAAAVTSACRWVISSALVLWLARSLMASRIALLFVPWMLAMFHPFRSDFDDPGSWLLLGLITAQVIGFAGYVIWDTAGDAPPRRASPVPPNPPEARRESPAIG